MLQQLKQERVFAHFFEICRYPHPSHHEQELSCYLYDWAKKLGLEVYQDEAWNLIIKKPASPGYETHPTVLLQAHIDMVCQKEEHVLRAANIYAAVAVHRIRYDAVSHIFFVDARKCVVSSVVIEPFVVCGAQHKHRATHERRIRLRIYAGNVAVAFVVQDRFL